ncbi:unnamed protein product [Rotaria sp. Silwood1]|nr:unnamed protein product [Rotaria sp. Silwood1]CAF1109306.1 unnamed protein product [Rotaria sp. Silwood1]CAF1450285.1 unnamed protein product [Rotaria sp. Silwood1]CAF3435081.1 unnamed protein product [Rotaria sp. Silwood1]CAF3672258.1 unnamed protein product [Rotaria sp. Silwood1]
MHMDINQYFFIFIGWLVRTSYQLDCIQCTSPIRHMSTSWDHSCLDGTLSPLPCEAIVNGSALTFQQCGSALYRISQRGSAGKIFTILFINDK